MTKPLPAHIKQANKYRRGLITQVTRLLKNPKNQMTYEVTAEEIGRDFDGSRVYSGYSTLVLKFKHTRRIRKVPKEFGRSH